MKQRDGTAGDGVLMTMVADGLTARGFHIRYPEWADGRRLTVSGLEGVRCAVTIGDAACVQWECSPWASDGADPVQIADLATSLLTGRGGGYPRQGDGYAREGITLKGIVGRELAARGLDVSLEVYEDTDFYDVRAAIVAVNPGTREDASVRVDDDGSITWECDYWAEAATITWDPEFSWHLTDPGKTAHAIIEKVTGAVSRALPVDSRITAAGDAVPRTELLAVPEDGGHA
jgi:hypothetical protein